MGPCQRLLVWLGAQAGGRSEGAWRPQGLGGGGTESLGGTGGPEGTVVTKGSR